MKIRYLLDLPEMMEWRFNDEPLKVLDYKYGKYGGRYNSGFSDSEETSNKISMVIHKYKKQKMKVKIR